MMNRNTLKKTLSVALLLALMLSLTACGADDPQATGGGQASVSMFSYWLGQPESTEFYMTYKENPVIDYVTRFRTFPDKDEKETTVAMEFVEPPKGKEIDNINTLISTSSYPDIVELTFLGTPVGQLYEDGMILDLTEHVENDMPNYKKYLDEHPDLAKYLQFDVNGEKKYLTIGSAIDEVSIDSQDFGYAYRRDWLVKYGTQPERFFDPRVDAEAKSNPNAGKAFSGYFSLDLDGNAVAHQTLQENTNGDSWVDDVLFPSGHADPTYISDWEWMFEVFSKAIVELEIDDSYPMSLYYPGYIANGDLVCAFGGGGPMWYINPEGVVEFGAASEGFKTYLECMNIWYANGWIDQRFAERSTDVFYRIDETSIRQGKVGLWMSATSMLDSRLYNADQPLTEGIVVYGAAQPINDLYGDESVQLKTPYTMYYGGDLIGLGIVVTDKAADKDIKLLCHYLDYFYSEEGSILKTFGLSAEQMAESQNAVYKKYGLEDGAYTVENVDGVDIYTYDPILAEDDGGIKSAMTGRRFNGLKLNANVDFNLTPTNEHSRSEWIKYPGTGFLGGMNIAQISAESTKFREKTRPRIEDEYMYINVPKFITGDKNFTTDWDTFLKDLSKRNYQKVTDQYNEHFANFK